jgi:hypothetical protein
MTYDASKPAGTDTIGASPALLRENFRALKEDAIVKAGTLNGYYQGNSSGNVALSNGTLCTTLNADLLDGANLSTDNTFSANSDTLIPSQKAVKAYADTKQASLGYTPVNKAGDAMTGDLAMGNHFITGLPAAIANGQPVRYDEFSTLSFNQPAYIPYSVNSGAQDANGYANILSKVSNTSATLLATTTNIVLTYPNGLQDTISSDVTFSSLSKGSTTVTSLTGSTTTATLTTPSAHGLAVGDVVTINGATTSSYFNGTFVIKTVPSSTTFTYTMNGSYTGTSAGTITYTAIYTVVKEYGYTAVVTNKSVTESTVAPSSPNTGDYWLNIGIKPYAPYKYNGSAWVVTQFVKLGEINITFSTMATPISYAFNGKYTTIQSNYILNTGYVLNHNIGTKNYNISFELKDTISGYTIIGYPQTHLSATDGRGLSVIYDKNISQITFLVWKMVFGIGITLYTPSGVCDFIARIERSF